MSSSPGSKHSSRPRKVGEFGVMADPELMQNFLTVFRQVMNRGRFCAASMITPCVNSAKAPLLCNSKARPPCPSLPRTPFNQYKNTKIRPIEVVTLPRLYNRPGPWTVTVSGIRRPCRIDVGGKLESCAPSVEYGHASFSLTPS